MNNLKGFFAILGSAIILSTFGILIRNLAPYFSDIGQVFMRSFFASVIIVAILFIKKVNPFAIAKINLKYIIGFSIVFPLSLICFTVSVNEIKVSNSLFMLYVGSLISTAIIGKLFFKETFTIQHYLSLIVVIIGLFIFIQPLSIDTISIGIFFGIASGIFEGSAHSLRKLLKNVQREIIVFFQSVSGIVIASILMIRSTDAIFIEYNINAIIIALVFGSLLVSIGYLLAYGFANFDVNWGTIILSTELFFALIVNYIFLNESPTNYELIGGTMIFFGSLIITLDKNYYKYLLTKLKLSK
jgi:drug/metabolite transporter (DMT)-like permease